MNYFVRTSSVSLFESSACTACSGMLRATIGLLLSYLSKYNAFVVYLPCLHFLYPATNKLVIGLQGFVSFELLGSDVAHLQD